MIIMSNEKKTEKGKKTSDMVKCCVKNCGKEIPIDQAIVINGKYFCGICGVAYYRSTLNF
jgi:ribosomal protein S26